MMFAIIVILSSSNFPLLLFYSALPSKWMLWWWSSFILQNKLNISEFFPRNRVFTFKYAVNFCSSSFHTQRSFHSFCVCVWFSNCLNSVNWGNSHSNQALLHSQPLVVHSPHSLIILFLVIEFPYTLGIIVAVTLDFVIPHEAIILDWNARIEMLVLQR